MSKHAHRDLEYIVLKDYIPSNHFRTILPETKAIPHGRNEISVTIEFSKESVFFKSVLPCYFIGMMYVYGFVHDNENLDKIFTGTMADEYKKRQISLYEWSDKFLIVFENGSRTLEKQFFVTVEDVWNLVGNCLHPT